VFVVTVAIQVIPAQWDVFMPLLMRNAATSMALEDKCLHFDVCTNPDSLNKVFLYEAYTDEAAFDAHLASKHFKDFDTLTRQMISAKEVATYSKVNV